MACILKYSLKSIKNEFTFVEELPQITADITRNEIQLL